MTEITREQALAHFGVKGMRWGVRRDKTTGIRPIAKSLDESRFGKLSKKNVDRYNAQSSAAKHREQTMLKGVAAVGVILAASGSVALAVGIHKTHTTRLGEQAVRKMLETPFQWKDQAGEWHRYAKTGGQWVTR